uniref:Epithelial cell adhesion molecule n=1 Tax=Bubo bubo TaxID=30461 RepID=A0A8C0EGA3_BUBBB
MLHNMTSWLFLVTSKCLLMKAEMTSSKSGRREKPKDAFEDTDGLYDPECENTGVFKAKQCNGTTCWCVNTAGVRRTDKHDEDLKCNQLVRTTWIIIEMKHYEKPYITIDLKQNSSDKSSGDVDIMNAYYNMKYIDNEALKFEKTVVYYVDEIAPEFSMKSLTPGLIAVIVVVIVAIVAAIVVLVSSKKALKQNG